MRPVEFQDSFNRIQSTEKYQAREAAKPNDDSLLASQKQAAKDEIKREQIQTTEESRDKLVDKDRDGNGQGYNSQQKKRQDEEAEKPRKRPPSGGVNLIDIDA